MKDNMKYNMIDLKVLVCSSREDLEAERWLAYPDYMAEFNRLLNIFGEIETSGISLVEPVPEVELPIDGIGGGSLAEKRKLREIVYKSERLLARMQKG